MPDRILTRVDFPAPFSPTSTWTSPARRSNATSSRATTPGKRFDIPRNSRTGAGTGAGAGPIVTALFEDSCILVPTATLCTGWRCHFDDEPSAAYAALGSCVLLQVLVDVLRRSQTRAGIDMLRDVIAVEVADHQIDADDPHGVRELQYVGREVTVLDRREAIFCAVEADDQDVVPTRRLECLESAERRRVIGRKDGHNVRIRREDVLCDGQAFILEPHRALVDNLDVRVGVQCFVQPVVAGLPRLVRQVTLEIEHFAFAANLVGDELAALLRRGDVVSLNQTDDVSSGWRGIDGQYRNTSGIRRLDTRHDTRRIDRAQDDAIVLLGDGGFHLTDLIGNAASGR